MTIPEAMGKNEEVYSNEELTRRIRELEMILQATLIFLERRDGARLEQVATTRGTGYEIAHWPVPE